jgi:hypothetical protein
MMAVNNRLKLTLAGQAGFVLPAVIFGLVLMSVVAITALLTARDELGSAQAQGQSSAAFYAAEAGFHEVWATWDSIQEQVDSLFPGDSLVLDWQTLVSGSKYQATVFRWDNGDQLMYALSVEGRGPGPLGGQRVLTYSLTSAGNAGYMLGFCCNAAVTVKGGVKLDGDQDGISGFDEHPPAWETANVCQDSLYDKPGVMMEDTTLLEMIDTAGTPYLIGDPPVVQDPYIDDGAFDNFGPLTWDSLRAMADIVMDGSVVEVLLDGSWVYPRYTTNLKGETVCDTSHPGNWGSDDPDDPCFNHFPIILIKGEVEIEKAYGQGIVIIDWDDSQPPGEKGGEFELEKNMVFNGIILGKGCVEIQKGAEFHGAVFVNSDYRNEDSCGGDWDYEMNEDDTDVIWSQCAVDRAIVNAGLADYADPEIMGAIRPLPLRAFGEALR